MRRSGSHGSNRGASTERVSTRMRISHAAPADCHIMADATLDADLMGDAGEYCSPDYVSGETADTVQRQTQRLAAIGMHTGELAHDLNNLLAAVVGYGERALKKTAHGSRLRHDLESVLAAGRQSRAL